MEPRDRGDDLSTLVTDLIFEITGHTVSHDTFRVPRDKAENMSKCTATSVRPRTPREPTLVHSYAESSYPFPDDLMEEVNNLTAPHGTLRMPRETVENSSRCSGASTYRSSHASAAPTPICPPCHAADMSAERECGMEPRDRDDDLSTLIADLMPEMTGHTVLHDTPQVPRDKAENDSHCAATSPSSFCTSATTTIAGRSLADTKRDRRPSTLRLSTGDSSMPILTDGIDEMKHRDVHHNTLRCAATATSSSYVTPAPPPLAWPSSSQPRQVHPRLQWLSPPIAAALTSIFFRTAGPSRLPRGHQVNWKILESCTTLHIILHSAPWEDGRDTEQALAIKAMREKEAGVHVCIPLKAFPYKRGSLDWMQSWAKAVHLVRESTEGTCIVMMRGDQPESAQEAELDIVRRKGVKTEDHLY